MVRFSRGRPPDMASSRVDAISHAIAFGDGAAGGELGLQAQARLGLLVGRDAQINDRPGHRSHPLFSGTVPMTALSSGNGAPIVS